MISENCLLIKEDQWSYGKGIEKEVKSGKERQRKRRQGQPLEYTCIHNFSPHV